MTGVDFEVKSYSVMLGQYVPVAHRYYQTLPMQGIIECFGNEKNQETNEKLTIYFLPFHLSVTKPLSDLKKFGGIIFANFQDFTPYIDLLKSSDKVYAHIDSDEPQLNRLYTKRTTRSKLH